MASGSRRPSGAPGGSRRTAPARRPGGARPGGTRPEQGASPRAQPPSAPTLANSKAAQRWRRTKGSTQRLAILGALTVLLGVMIVPTLRAYLAQRDEYAALAEQVALQEATVAGLTTEEARWHDPAYIEQQARVRLKMVRPGDISYEVVGVDSVAQGEPGSGHGAVVDPPTSAKLPWYGRVWSSIVSTDAKGHSSVEANTTPIDPTKKDPSTSSATASGTSKGPTTSKSSATSGASAGSAPSASPTTR